MDELRLYEQFQELSLSFPKLRLQKYQEGPWSVRGLLSFSFVYSGHQIDDMYSIEIYIPERFPDTLPKTLEVGNRIPRNFHHYEDESLCLGSPLAVKQVFRKDPTLLGYVRNCLIPYLYSFSYKNKFGKMPFGELSHGWLGILEYYKDLFNLKDNMQVLKLIQILAEDNYLADNKCPCRSGKRLHSCHGKILLAIRELQPPTTFQNEYVNIAKTLVNKAIKTRYPSFICR